MKTLRTSDSSAFFVTAPAGEGLRMPDQDFKFIQMETQNFSRWRILLGG